MCVIEENESGSNNAGWKRVARLPHNVENGRNGESPNQGWHGSEGNVWDVVVDVRVTDVLKMEMSIVAYEPTHKGEQKLSERRMNIEEVCAFEIVRGELLKEYTSACTHLRFCGFSAIYLSKMDLIEHDLVGMTDAPKPRDKSENSDDG